MRVGMICLLGALVWLAASVPARAQYGSSRLEKWEFTPFAGYETSGSYPLTSSTVTVNDLRINGATSFGTFIGYSLTSNAQFEFLWNRNLTSYSVQQTPGMAYTKAYNSSVDQFQFGALYMFLGDEHKWRPYFAAIRANPLIISSGPTLCRTMLSPLGNASTLMSVATTLLAPACRRACTSAPPIPPAAPVTTAIFPLGSMRPTL